MHSFSPSSYTNLTGALVLLKYLFSHSSMSVCSCCSHSMQDSLSALWFNFSIVLLQDIFPIHPHLSLGWMPSSLLSVNEYYILKLCFLMLPVEIVFKYPYTSVLAQCLARNDQQKC